MNHQNDTWSLNQSIEVGNHSSEASKRFLKVKSNNINELLTRHFHLEKDKQKETPKAGMNDR